MPLISQKELAGHLGLSTRQVRNLEADGVLLPQLDASGKKAYPWPESNQRYWSHKIEAERGRTTSVEARQEEADARKAEADAEAAEIRTALLRKSVISIDDVERLVAEPLEAVMGAIKNVPSRWGPMLVGCTTTQEAIARLKPAVNEMIEALMGMGAEISAELEDDDQSNAA